VSVSGRRRGLGRFDVISSLSTSSFVAGAYQHGQRTVRHQVLYCIVLCCVVWHCVVTSTDSGSSVSRSSTRQRPFPPLLDCTSSVIILSLVCRITTLHPCERNVNSLRRGRGGQLKAFAPPQKKKWGWQKKLSKNFLTLRKCSSKNEKYGVEKPPFLQHLEAKLEL